MNKNLYLRFVYNDILNHLYKILIEFVCFFCLITRKISKLDLTNNPWQIERYFFNEMYYVLRKKTTLGRYTILRVLFLNLAYVHINAFGSLF